MTYWDVFYYLVVVTWRPEHQLQMLISPDVEGKLFVLCVFFGGGLGGWWIQKKTAGLPEQRFWGGGEYL